MTTTAEPLAGTKVASSEVPSWRRGLVVLGACVGLVTGFTSMFFGTLPFFLLPVSAEFGWSRTEVTSATVLAMLGASVGAPLIGRLFLRFGTERVIGGSVVLFALGLLAMSQVPRNLYLMAALCFAIGFAACGTTVLGYMSLMPQWFDRRLGLALGVAGLGGGLGIGLAPFVATRLIGQFGWRGAYMGMAALVLGTGIVAWLLISVRGAKARRVALREAARNPQTPVADLVELTGVSLGGALADWRFWLIMIVTFVTTGAILGAAVHGVTLATERGLTPDQAATAAALAGLGALSARVCAGALIDRFHAPAVGVIVFALGATGLFLNSTATAFPIIVTGTTLGGIAIGAEGDLLPFFVRRYFGTKAFGVIFGFVYAAYTLGGVLGPIAYGFSYDQTGSYEFIMRAGAAASVISGVALLLLGAYRYRAAHAPRLAAA